MTQFLPPNLLALFAPRDPIPFLPPVDKLPHEKKATHNYSGIAQYVHLFEDPVSTLMCTLCFMLSLMLPTDIDPNLFRWTLLQ